ncbi:signal peptidase II [Caldisalinibacter kiritimatiensis]|uniref:Lipoprotein signal peptidase n=1 Tax=Caldisalinibacter kiritimatiensis TaxID=1304284 RepID=R1CG52_9FIRM|nr:signal peptidase II [Caldisalinibacter kiritimatiensis]EOD01295.1 Lipoprotein signal peptidase [Caldisalinibacter kiritimatiensis]
MLYIVTLLILITDQLTKYYADKLLKGNAPYVIINGFLQFNYVENVGAAFGILKNKQLFFIILTFIVLIGMVLFMIKNKRLNIYMRWGLVLIIAGAIGNLIDRIRLGYVIDFIDVKFGSFYDYPVFNIADCAIVIGTILVSYLVLFDKYETTGSEW